MSRSDELARDPVGNGFSLVGFAVRLVDGRFVVEWSILNPRAGLFVTDKRSEACVYDDRKCADWMARKVGGDVAEVWESPTERLMRWGEWPEVAAIADTSMT